MDKDRVDGVGKKVAGSVKEAIGKVTGDTRLQAEGTGQTRRPARLRTPLAGPRARPATLADK